MRSINTIAYEIIRDWKKVYFGAVPYLQAMTQLDNIDDMYGADDARSVVLYFLSNATTWRGDVARRIKKELNNMLKGRSSGLGCCCFGDDPTEAYRRQRVAEINADSRGRAALEAEYGQVWDTQELQRDFEVLGFMAPFVVVRRLSDGKKGSLEFRHSPRLYFNFTVDSGR
jgi:hypothetical protein